MGALCSWWLLSIIGLCPNEVCVQHGLDAVQSEIFAKRDFVQQKSSVQHEASVQAWARKKENAFYFAKPNWWANFFHNFKLSGFISSLVLCCCQDETARDREREKETPKAIVSKMLTQCCQDQGTKGERCREKIIQCPHKTEKAFIWYILVKDLKIFCLIHRLSFKDPLRLIWPCCISLDLCMHIQFVLNLLDFQTYR